ncbi:acyltransferase [Thalassotalea sediminis]|uniref:acyltransferase n=1 Tax=Thalassotalea sediminis TaxID=1759089 RepID=UPI0025746A89|nr:acyltransferase [Thalassotalea sediminis]
MRSILKLLILITKDFSIFSSPGLRHIRWWLYRQYYNAERLYVDTRVTITKAHTNQSSLLQMGEDVRIGKDVYIDFSGGLTISDHVSISEGTKIYTHNHNIHDGHKNWQKNGITFSSLQIEKYCWISANAIILPSVTEIGEGAVIAAGAILTKNAEPYCIYAGNPAKKIGKRRVNEDQQ